MNHIGKQIANVRKTRGFSQYDLSDMTGISQRMICYYETSDNAPPLEQLIKISKALKVTLDELVGVKWIKETLSPKDIKLWNSCPFPRFNHKRAAIFSF